MEGEGVNLMKVSPKDHNTRVFHGVPETTLWFSYCYYYYYY